jgi:hypothetical protein
MLAFIWDRLHRYRRQKTQIDQWDAQGRTIKCLLTDLHEQTSSSCEPYTSCGYDVNTRSCNSFWKRRIFHDTPYD